jgi:hypothetical protein
MSEVTDFIAALAAIAKDPDAWTKRLGDVRAAGDKLAEARMAQRQAEKAAEQASADRSTAAYDRGQADKAMRDGAQQATVNEKRHQELNVRDKELNEREARLTQELAIRNAQIEHNEAELERREKAAEAKLKEAQALMANYDKAKHDAALKLAS